MHRFGASGVLHILDDFVFIAKIETKSNGFIEFSAFVWLPRSADCPGENCWPISGHIHLVCGHNTRLSTTGSSFSGRQA